MKMFWKALAFLCLMASALSVLMIAPAHIANAVNGLTDPWLRGQGHQLGSSAGFDIADFLPFWPTAVGLALTSLFLALSRKEQGTR